MRLKDLFIKRFSEAGYSDNLMVKLMNVSQREKEDVRDYVTKVRGLYKRIPTAEQPNERAISTIFINGIRNEELYKALASNSNLQRDMLARVFVNPKTRKIEKCGKMQDKSRKGV